MDRDTIRDYLELTSMIPAQAEALSHIFAEMATKSDLVELDARLDARLTGRIADLEARLTWRMIAVVGFFATASTLLNTFLGRVLATVI